MLTCVLKTQDKKPKGDIIS